jgi:hypothetical protein
MAAKASVRPQPPMSASLTDIITLTDRPRPRCRHPGLKWPEVASANVKPTGLLVTNP